jgi:hypothetical protein
MLRFSKEKTKDAPQLWTIGELVASCKPGTTFTVVHTDHYKPNLYMIVRGGDNFSKEIVCLSLGNGQLFTRNNSAGGDYGQWSYNDGQVVLSDDRIFRVVDANVEVILDS